MTPSYAQNKSRAKKRRAVPRARNSTIAKNSVAVKRSNPARKAREFKRAYGSKARVAWVKSLPCVACGVVGYSENAHVTSGGVGRKADASQIVPLCGARPLFGLPGYAGTEGCHREAHRTGRELFAQRWKLDLDAAAAATETAWLAHINGVSA